MIESLPHIHLGDLPTTVAAVAAIVAGAYAVMTYRSTRDALRNQREANVAQKALLDQQLADQLATNRAQRQALERDRADRDAREERESRAHAEHVTITAAGSSTSLPGSGPQMFGLTVNNDWPEPIRNVTAWAKTSRHSSISGGVTPVIRPHSGMHLQVAFETHETIDHPGLRFWVEFFAGGVEWQVTADGRVRSRTNAQDPWRVRRPAPGDPVA